MKYRVEINRSQFDAMPIAVLPVDSETGEDVIPIGAEVHVFTDAELRARDERVIRAALEWWDFDGSYGCIPVWEESRHVDLDTTIAAAEADQ